MTDTEPIDIDEADPSTVLTSWWPGPCPDGCTCLDPFTGELPALPRLGGRDLSRHRSTKLVAAEHFAFCPDQFDPQDGRGPGAPFQVYSRKARPCDSSLSSASTTTSSNAPSPSARSPVSCGRRARLRRR